MKNNKQPREGNDTTLALLSSPWKNPAYPRAQSDTESLFSRLQNRDIEKLFQVMKVLAAKANEEADAIGTKTQQGEVNQYPYGLWFNLPLHAFPESISKEDARYVLGMLHEYFGVLKSLAYYGDYEFSVKFNLEALDFLFLKGLVDEKYTQAGMGNAETKNLSSTISFNEKNSTLIFFGKEIKISESKRSGQHLVLKIIFDNVYKELTYDEVFSALNEGIDYEKRFGKSIRNRCYQINKKIAVKTMVEDFLINTNRTVKINEKYLSQIS